MNPGIEQLTVNIRAWARARGIDKADPSRQFLKVAEEFGEIAAALARGKDEELKDAIGDTFVTLVILAAQCGTSIEECAYLAYEEIKGRKGKMVDGVFIKEQEKCTCKRAEFTRTVTEDYEPMCGRCGKPI
jgi:NTP pyrophosphatase (non-canonical NTP hydrolase)